MITPMGNENAQFDFGRNWEAFSEHPLTVARVEQAKKDFTELLGGIDLRDRSFLDMGFGQGLTLLAAASMGAHPVGCDINLLCVNVLQNNQRRYFPELSERTLPTVAGSILDEAVVESLPEKSPDRKTRAYEIVHAWGVLHHTGQMESAIRAGASLVAPNGYLIIAIAEIERMLHAIGFDIVKAVLADVPTGCNEFMFQRKAAGTGGANSCL